VLKSNSPSVVSIALDVAGNRFAKKLPSDMTLWQVLRQFEEAEKGLHVTGRGVPQSKQGAGQLYYERPVVNIMGRDYLELQDLQRTLSQCGINSGSMVLRVSFRITEKPLYQAMEEIDRYFNDVEPTESSDKGKKPEQPAVKPTPKEAPSKGTLAEDTAGATALPTITGDDTGDAAPGVQQDSIIPADVIGVEQQSILQTEAIDAIQPTGVFAAPLSSTPVAAHVREDDSVYEPTIAHAQLRQQQLLARAQNKRLKSDAELAADQAVEAAKLAKITKSDIKIRFPDQTSAQWEVNPEHTGTFLYQAIRSVMAHPDQHFKLIEPGPHIVVQDDNKRLIADYQLKGRVLLNLVWDDAASLGARKSPFLKSSVASKAQPVVVPEVPQSGPYDRNAASAGPSTKWMPDKMESAIDPEVIKKKLGKFFKLPGKK